MSRSQPDSLFNLSLLTAVILSLQILGIPPSNLLGYRIQDFIPEEDFTFYESRWAEGKDLFSHAFFLFQSDPPSLPP